MLKAESHPPRVHKTHFLTLNRAITGSEYRNNIVGFAVCAYRCIFYLWVLHIIQQCVVFFDQILIIFRDP